MAGVVLVHPMRRDADPIAESRRIRSPFA